MENERLTIDEQGAKLNAQELTAVREEENPHLLALTTCSTDFTDSRTVLLTVMRERTDSTDEGM